MSKKIILLIVGVLLCNLITTSYVSATGAFDNIKDSLEDLFKLKSELEISVDEELSTNEIIIPPDSSLWMWLITVAAETPIDFANSL